MIKIIEVIKIIKKLTIEIKSIFSHVDNMEVEKLTNYFLNKEKKESVKYYEEQIIKSEETIKEAKNKLKELKKV